MVRGGAELPVVSWHPGCPLELGAQQSGTQDQVFLGAKWIFEGWNLHPRPHDPFSEEKDELFLEGSLAVT